MEERGVRKLSTNHVCGAGLLGLADPALLRADLDRDRAQTRASIPWRSIDTLEGLIDWFRSTSRSSPSRSRAGARPGRGLPQGRGLLLRLQAGLLRQRPLVPRRRGRGRSSTRSTRRARTTSRCRTRSRRIWSPASSTARTSTERAEAHDDLYLAAYRTHLTFYERPVRVLAQPARDEREDRRQQHPSTGACNALLFFHRKFTDLDFMAARPAGRRADLGDHAAARGDVPRVERVRVSRVAPRARVDGRRSPRCSSATMDLAGASTTTTLKRQGSPPTPT